MRDTVSSIQENLSNTDSEILRHITGGNKEAEEKCVVLKELNRENIKQIQAIDIPGHFNFRERI